MAKPTVKPRVVLDTNVIVSALVYGGVPKQVLKLVLENSVVGITSTALLIELTGILLSRFQFSDHKLEQVQRKLKQKFVFVHSSRRLTVLKDDPDNRVLEAAIAGKANWVVTGDKEMLDLEKYREIRITTPRQFLDTVYN